MPAPAVTDTTTATNLVEQAAIVMRELYQAEQANTSLTTKRVSLSVNPATGIMTFGWAVPSTVGDSASGGVSLTPTDYFPA